MIDEPPSLALTGLPLVVARSCAQTSGGRDAIKRRATIGMRDKRANSDFRFDFSFIDASSVDVRFSLVI